MKKASYIFILSIIGLNTINAQRFADQVPQTKRYLQAEVIDPNEGIKVYNKLIDAIGGDSIAYNKAGYNMQGWNEDYYMSGKLLHRGYYIDGKVIVFKNFFENGIVERTVINPDPLHCNIDVYYENGKQRMQTMYYDGLPQKQYEFYSSGLPKYAEENEKEMKYVNVKKSWYETGQLKESMELADAKTKKYIQKNYYENGQLKSEGIMGLSADGKSYIKEGTWTFYDSNGKNKRTEP